MNVTYNRHYMFILQATDNKKFIFFSKMKSDLTFPAKTFPPKNHTYRRAKIDCLSFVMCPLLAQLIIGFFLLRPFTVIMKKIRAVKQSIILRCLCNKSIRVVKKTKADIFENWTCLFKTSTAVWSQLTFFFFS